LAHNFVKTCIFYSTYVSYASQKASVFPRSASKHVSPTKKPKDVDVWQDIDQRPCMTPYPCGSDVFYIVKVIGGENNHVSVCPFTIMCQDKRGFRVFFIKNRSFPSINNLHTSSLRSSCLFILNDSFDHDVLSVSVWNKR